MACGIVVCLVAGGRDDEVLAFVEARQLMGRGLCWIDMCLLASARLAKLQFWTLDKGLAAAATELGLGLR